MSLLPKISKLVRIPELLKHKKQEEEHQKRQRQKKERERNSNFIFNQVTISQTSKNYLEVDTPSKIPEIVNERKEGKGAKIDLRA